MELSLEQTWEIFEFTVLKRDEHQNLTDVVTVHLYDDDRDIFLNLKGYGEAAIQTAITAIKESLNISPFSLENAEPNTIYFNIGGNPHKQNFEMQCSPQFRSYSPLDSS